MKNYIVNFWNNDVLIKKIHAVSQIVSFVLMIIFFVVLSVCLAHGATITPNGTRIIDSEKQVCFFTLTENGEDYRYTANTPVLSGQDLTDWLNARALYYWYQILYQMYPGADFKSFEGDNKLEQLQAWIDAGAVNIIQCEEDTTEQCQQVIEKVDWVGGWDVEKVTAGQDAKNSIFYGKTAEQIDTYIDNNWTTLITSKELFKLLVREVIVLRKQLGLNK